MTSMRLNLRILLFTVCLTVVAHAGPLPQAPQPLGKDQVVEFVKVGMATAKLVKLIQDHGLDFDPAEDYLQDLRKAGAQDPVIQALHAARPKPLTKDQVLGLVAQDLPPERAVMLVKQRGVDFVVDDAYIATLRLAGGNDELIAALREARVRVTVPVRRFAGHALTADAVAFSPDGKFVASGSQDKSAKLWDMATGTLRHNLEPPAELSGVRAVAFTPDGKLLAIGAGISGVTLWDVATGALKQTLSPNQTGTWAVAFSPDGELLAGGGVDSTVRLWDTATGGLQRTLSGHTGLVGAVAFSPDGKLLASGSWDMKVKIWDVTSGNLLHTAFAHNNWVNSVAFSPDGKLLASGSEDGAVKLWDVATGALQHSLPGANDIVEFVGFSPDGKLLIAGEHGAGIKVWDVSTWNLKDQFGQACGYGDALSPDGKLLACGASDLTVTIWRLREY